MELSDQHQLRIWAHPYLGHGFSKILIGLTLKTGSTCFFKGMQLEPDFQSSSVPNSCGNEWELST